MKVCPGCNADLTGTHGKRVYCSNACRVWVSSGHTELRVTATSCIRCGAPMAGKMVGAVYCTIKCKLQASQERRREDGREHIRNHARYPAEREKRIAYATAYFARNPHVAQVTKRNRRSAMAGGKVSPRDWIRLCRRYDNRCAYCREARPLTMDHVVPLIRGGSNTIGNILPACASCNSSKHGRFIMEWRLGRPRRTTRRVDAVSAGV